MENHSTLFFHAAVLLSALVLDGEKAQRGASPDLYSKAEVSVKSV